MVEGVPGWKWDASLTPVWLLTNVGNLAKLLNFLVFNFPILKIKDLPEINSCHAI